MLQWLIAVEKICSKKLPWCVTGKNLKTKKSTLLQAIPEIDALLLQKEDSDAKKTVGTILSLSKIADYGRYFIGDRDLIDIYDENTDELVMTSPRNSPGFWIVDLQLTTNISANPALMKGELKFTNEQAKRPIATRKLYCTLGNPYDNVLSTMLDTNAIVNCIYISADGRNAYYYLEPCQPCKAGKFVEIPAPKSMSPPATKIGDSVHADLIPLSTPTIAGNTALMLLQDEYSGYFTVVALRNKHKECVRDGIIAVDAMYRSHGHAIRRLHTDAEPVFTSIVEQLAAIGILHVQSIPGRHARRIERAIRTLKERARTILASLPFELPKSLLGEAYAYVQNCINLVPSNSRGGMVPYTTLHGTRPDYQSWTAPFGRVAQFKSITDTSIKSCATYGITLGPGPMAANTVKGNIPASNHDVMRHLKNVHILPLNVPPSEW